MVVYWFHDVAGWLHERGNASWCTASADFPGNSVGLCPGTGGKWKWSFCEYRFFEVFFLLVHKVKSSVRRYLMSAGYQHFREHLYHMSLEEAKAPEVFFIPITPIAFFLA